MSRHRFWLLFCFVLTLLAGCRPSIPEPPKASPVVVTGHPIFEDVTEHAGIHFTHTNGASGKFHFIEFGPAGCALFDYDNDGFLDILLIQSGSSEPPGQVTDRPHCVLYHNNRDGTFSDATARSGLDTDLGYAHGIAVADYDNDGYEDLFITGYGRNFLFHNEKGSGKFTDVTHAMGLDKPHGSGYATSAAFGDYDNDGRLDLYVCYYARWTWDSDKNCVNEQKERDYCSPELYEPETHRLYHNEGNHFTDVSEKSGITKVTGRGLAVVFLDFNNDGRQDIFVANDMTPNFLFENLGNGKFAEVALKAGVAFSDEGALMAGMGITTADLKHTGRESLFVTNFSGMPNTLFENAGKGMFQNTSMVSGLALPHEKFLAFGCAFLDYDADSWPDLLVTNGSVYVHAESRLDGATYRERKQLFHNSGDGTFAEIVKPEELGNLSVPMVGRGLAVGDFDNDGRIDALFNNQNGAAQLFRNADKSGNHWVRFKTIGTRSNRDGLHTRFLLTAGKVTQSATVRANTGYLSSSDPRIYFGLGTAAKIDTVEVRWPSGRVDVLKNLPPDRTYTLTEGKGITDTHSR